MNKFELRLDFDEIRNRIELDMSKIKPGEWAKAIGISKSLISNVHGGSKRQNPPLPYIIAVARHTGKPVEWYLYGEMTTQFTGTISESQKSYNVDERPKFCDSAWSPDDIRYCKQLKKILDSDHPIIKPAIISNLAAFEHSVKIEQEKASDAIDMQDLKKRLQHLEKLTDPAGHHTGTDEAE